MNVCNWVDGRSTSLGHSATHSWHAVQCCDKWLKLIAPGGSGRVLISYVFFPTILDFGRSMCFSLILTNAVAVTAAVAAKKRRREGSLGPFVGFDFFNE